MHHNSSYGVLTLPSLPGSVVHGSNVVIETNGAVLNCFFLRDFFVRFLTEERARVSVSALHGQQSESRSSQLYLDQVMCDEG